VLGPADTLTVQDGGTASGNVLLGTTITINLGGTALSDLVTDNARETVDGLDDGSTVADGGVITIQSDGAANSLRVVAGGELIVNGPATPGLAGEAFSTTISAAGLMEGATAGWPATRR